MIQNKGKYLLIASILSIVLLAILAVPITASYCLYEIALFVRDGRQAIKQTSPELASTITSSKSLLTKIDSFITPDRLVYVDDAIKAQIKSTDEATKSANKVAIATAKTLENHLQPAIDELKSEAKETLLSVRKQVSSLDSLTKETTHQLKQNGDQVKSLLQTSESMIIKSEPELLATLAQLKGSAKSLQVITNDSALLDTLRNIKDSTYNVSLVTNDLSDLSRHLIDPIVNPKPPKNKFDKFFLRPTVKVLKILNGAGNVLFLVDRLNP
jgi:seryl-tRNA synthetase